MIDFFGRLDIFMKHNGLNDNKITVETGISNGLIGKGRKRGALSQDSISKILHTYEDLDANWLFTGQGAMLKSKKTGGSSGVNQTSVATPQNSPTDLKALTDLVQTISEQKTNLATQLGMQIKENEHLRRENMRLRAQLETLKEKKGKKMPELSTKAYENKNIGSQNLAAESEIMNKK